MKLEELKGKNFAISFTTTKDMDKCLSILAANGIKEGSRESWGKQTHIVCYEYNVCRIRNFEGTGSEYVVPASSFIASNA